MFYIVIVMLMFQGGIVEQDDYFLGIACIKNVSFDISVHCIRIGDFSA